MVCHTWWFPVFNNIQTTFFLPRQLSELQDFSFSDTFKWRILGTLLGLNFGLFTTSEKWDILAWIFKYWYKNWASWSISGFGSVFVKCVKNWDIFSMHCIQKSHVFLSLHISSPERNLGDGRQEVKGRRIPRARRIISSQNIQKEGFRLSPEKCSVYSRGLTVQDKLDPDYSASHSHWLAGPSQRISSLFSFPEDLETPGFSLLHIEAWTCTHFSKEEQIVSCPTIGKGILLDAYVWKFSLKQVSQTKEARGL